MILLANEAAHGAGVGPHDSVIMFSTLVVVSVILASAAWARTQIATVPKGMAAVYEHMFDWLDGIAQGFMGKEGRNYVPMTMSFFLFILMSNWMGMVPLPPLIATSADPHAHHIPVFEAPTSSYNTTLALAILAFLAFNLLGLKKRIFPPSHSHDHAHDGHTHDHDGHTHSHDEHHQAQGGVVGLWTWISHFWAPTPSILKSAKSTFEYILVPFLFVLFLGLNFVEEFARILSLSLRLYGNIFGEHTAKEKILDTMYNFFTSPDVLEKFLSIIVWGASLVVSLLGGLAGFIQAMVFSLLLLSYIAHAVADEH